MVSEVGRLLVLKVYPKCPSAGRFVVVFCAKRRHFFRSLSIASLLKCLTYLARRYKILGKLIQDAREGRYGQYKDGK
jgi:hypothetical protein